MKISHHTPATSHRTRTSCSGAPKAAHTVVRTGRRSDFRLSHIVESVVRNSNVNEPNSGNSNANSNANAGNNRNCAQHTRRKILQA